MYLIDKKNNNDVSLNDTWFNVHYYWKQFPGSWVAKEVFEHIRCVLNPTKNPDDRYFYQSASRIAQECFSNSTISESTLRNKICAALKELQHLGYLKAVGHLQNGTVVYEIMQPDHWLKPFNLSYRASLKWNEAYINDTKTVKTHRGINYQVPRQPHRLAPDKIFCPTRNSSNDDLPVIPGVTWHNSSNDAPVIPGMHNKYNDINNKKEIKEEQPVFSSTNTTGEAKSKTHITSGTTEVKDQKPKAPKPQRRESQVSKNETKEKPKSAKDRKTEKAQQWLKDNGFSRLVVTEDGHGIHNWSQEAIEAARDVWNANHKDDKFKHPLGAIDRGSEVADAAVTYLNNSINNEEIERLDLILSRMIHNSKQINTSTEYRQGLYQFMKERASKFGIELVDSATKASRYYEIHPYHNGLPLIIGEKDRDLSRETVYFYLMHWSDVISSDGNLAAVEKSPGKLIDSTWDKYQRGECDDVNSHGQNAVYERFVRGVN